MFFSERVVALVSHAGLLEVEGMRQCNTVFSNMLYSNSASLTIMT